MEATNKIRDRSLGKLISELSRLASSYFQKRFRKYDIGPSQVITLHFIAGSNGISQSDLTRLLDIDKSSVSSQLHTLEKNAYIERRPASGDSRVKRIYVTERTKAIEASLHEDFASWTEILLDGLSGEERKTVFSLLEKIKKNAQRTIQEM